ncbi:MAG: patatin-like phospholipase family protein [Candidatus Eremiobacteraeota bacterium]|nr:patatin-like phospholipase family protein [Candidatus Eremiobacteraeota bacterium]MBV8281027.1 patatin-like phospholipase family protein [Candidatus Eremiobacteraeota bacterium]
MKVSRFAFLGALGGAAAAAAATRAQAALPPWYPLPPPLKPRLPTRALVLSGAGARGAYEAGVMKWLYRNIDAEQPYDFVSGTSAGAINASFAARATSASIAQAAQLWLGMPQAGVMTLIPPAQHAVNAADQFQESTEHGYPRKLRYLSKANSEIKAMGPKEDLVKIMGVVSSDGIDGLVKKYPFTIAEMKTGLIINATNMTRFSSDSFYHFTGSAAAAQQATFLTRMSLTSSNVAGPAVQPTGQRYALNESNLIPAVLGSAAVPGVFQPVEVPIAETGNSDLYVDGGVANNTPISTAVAAGATDVTVVISSAPGEGMQKQPDSLPRLLQGSFAVIQRELLEDDIRLSLARNILSRYRDYHGLNERTIAVLHSIQMTEWVPVTLRIIRPSKPLTLTAVGFDNGPELQAAFDQGYADAQNPAIFQA